MRLLLLILTICLLCGCGDVINMMSLEGGDLPLSVSGVSDREIPASSPSFSMSVSGGTNPRFSSITIGTFTITNAGSVYSPNVSGASPGETVTISYTATNDEGATTLGSFTITWVQPAPPLIRFTDNNISATAGGSINTSVQLIDENNAAANLQITTASLSGHGITLRRTSPTTMDITGTAPQSPDALAFFVPYTYTHNGESLSGKAHLTIRINR